MQPTDHATDPRYVAGFAAAQAAGLLPVVPAQPPTPSVPNSNHASLWMVAVLIGGGVIGALLGSDSLWFRFLMVALFGVLVAGTQLPAALRLREYAAGYCRSHDWTGMPPLMIGSQNQAGPAGCQWNSRGLWLLDGRGQVAAQPDPAFLPPGRYPCNENGDWDLWTGAQWLGRPKPGPRVGDTV